MNGTMTERRSGAAYSMHSPIRAAAIAAAGLTGSGLIDIIIAAARRNDGFGIVQNAELADRSGKSTATIKRIIGKLGAAGVIYGFTVRRADGGHGERRAIVVADVVPDGLARPAALDDPAAVVPFDFRGAKRRPVRVADLQAVDYCGSPLIRNPPHCGSPVIRSYARASDLREIEERGQPADARASAPLDASRPIPSGSAIWGESIPTEDDDAEPSPMPWTLPTVFDDPAEVDRLPTGTLGGPSAEIVPLGTVSGRPAETVSSETISTAAPVPIVDTAPQPATGTRHEAAVEPKAKSRATSKVTTPTAPRTIAAAWYAAVSRFTERTGRRIARHEDDRKDLRTIKAFAGAVEDVDTWAIAFDLALSSPEFWADLDARKNPIPPIRKIMFDRDAFFHRAANINRERHRNEREIEATRERIEREKREEIESLRAAPIDRAAQIAKRKAEVLASLAGAAQ